MSRLESKRVPTTIAALALVLLVALYSSGYFWLGRRIEFKPNGGLVCVVRVYRHRWLAIIYRPVGVLEGWLTGVEVLVRPPLPPEILEALEHSGPAP